MLRLPKISGSSIIRVGYKTDGLASGFALTLIITEEAK